jgi:hypothetical protein
MFLNTDSLEILKYPNFGCRVHTSQSTCRSRMDYSMKEGTFCRDFLFHGYALPNTFHGVIRPSSSASLNSISSRFPDNTPSRISHHVAPIVPLPRQKDNYASCFFHRAILLKSLCLQKATAQAVGERHLHAFHLPETEGCHHANVPTSPRSQRAL